MKLLLTIIALILGGVLLGQEHHESIQIAFKQYKKALLTQDFPTLVSLAHPEIVKNGGGSAYYTDKLISDINMYRAGGLEVVDIELGNVLKVLISKHDLQAMVSYRRLLKKGETIVEEKNLFFVMSQDQGKSWSFTDMKKYGPRSIRLFVPEYNERLNIYVNSINH